MRRMRNAIRRPIFVWISFTLLIVQLGCAHAPPYPQPPSEEVRAALGTIGVVSAAAAHEEQLKGPTRGKLHGAAKGAMKGFWQGAWAGLEAWIIGAPVFGAIGGTIGLGLGAIIARSGSEVKEAEAALNKALGDLRLQETLRDRVLEAAREKTQHTFVLVEDQTPYSSLADKGIDTVLEIGVAELRFEGQGINPPLTLFVNVRARLIRVSDETELYVYTLDPPSTDARKFTEWAADDARPLRDELEDINRYLAKQIVEKLFLQYRNQ